MVGGGGGLQSDQKQSAPLQTVSVPPFTHPRQGTRSGGSRPYTHTHQHTFTPIHAHTYTHTHTLPLQGTLCDPSPLARYRRYTGALQLQLSCRGHLGRQDTQVSLHAPSCSFMFLHAAAASQVGQPAETCSLKGWLIVIVCVGDEMLIERCWDH